MYVGGWIVKKKGLPPLAWNFQVFVFLSQQVR